MDSFTSLIVTNYDVFLLLGIIFLLHVWMGKVSLLMQRITLKLVYNQGIHLQECLTVACGGFSQDVQCLKSCLTGDSSRDLEAKIVVIGEVLYEPVL